MIIRQRTRRGIVALAAAGLIPLGLVAAAPAAQSAPSEPAAPTAQAPATQDTRATTYQGRVTVGLNLRAAPTSAAGKTGSLAAGTRVTIQCKVFGPSVSGNSLWYKLGTGKWASARYIANIGTAPRFCGTGTEYVGRVATASLAVRSGPNTANAKVSTYTRGQRLNIVCKVDSQRIDGNTRWYQLTGDSGGQWVSARYVTNVGAIPPYC